MKTRPARRPPPKLGRALAPQIRKLAEKTGAMDPRLAADWGEIAGPEIAHLCRPLRIVRKGKVQALEVSVKSGAAAMRLQYSQEALLGRLRQRLGLPHLTKLQIREGAPVRGWEKRRMAPTPAEAPKGERSGSGPKAESLREALDQMRQTIHQKEHQAQPIHQKDR